MKTTEIYEAILKELGETSPARLDREKYVISAAKERDIRVGKRTYRGAVWTTHLHGHKRREEKRHWLLVLYQEKYDQYGKFTPKIVRMFEVPPKPVKTKKSVAFYYNQNCWLKKYQVFCLPGT